MQEPLHSFIYNLHFKYGIYFIQSCDYQTSVSLIEHFHMMAPAFDRYLKMRLRHIGVPCKLYIVKKDKEI